MSRYIKLADALQTLSDTCYLDEIDKNMQELPSIDIDDAVSVVRCRECKHKYQEPWHDGVAVEGECEIWHNATLDDDYCSYGEKEGER